MDNESDEATEYEFKPFETIFLSRRDEILRLVHVSSVALRSMNGVTHLSEVLRKNEEEVKAMREVEAIALREVESDFPLLHNAAAVLLWGALETSFQDFLVRWLSQNPNALQVPTLQKVRVNVAEYEALVGENRMRYLVGILERELAASLKPGVGRFDCLLKPFGISAKVAKDDRRNLSELAAVRNVIVHRASIADSRFLELCPWLDLCEGAAVNVTGDSLMRYIGSASRYAAAIIESARGLSGKTS